MKCESNRIELDLNNAGFAQTITVGRTAADAVLKYDKNLTFSKRPRALNS